MLQKDLGTALIYYGVILVMVWAATRSYLYLGLGFAGAAAGGIIGYNMFSHVKRRVAIWINAASVRSKACPAAVANQSGVVRGEWGRMSGMAAL